MKKIGLSPIKKMTVQNLICSVLVLCLPLLCIGFENQTAASPDGNYWSVMSIPYSSSDWWLNGVDFYYPSAGCAVGRDASNKVSFLLHYFAGNWTAVAPPDISSQWWLSAVRFIPPTNSLPSQCLAVGYDAEHGRGLLIKYHYDSQVPPVTPSVPAVSSNWWLDGIHFSASTEGWAVGYDVVNNRGVLLHYSNDSWTSVTPPSVSSGWRLYDVYFTSPDDGWAAGHDLENKKGVLLHYSNGNWAVVTPPQISADWSLEGKCIHFISPDDGWAVGEDSANKKGVLLRYAGGSWSTVSLPGVSSDWGLSALHFTSSSEGWASGYDAENHRGVFLRYSSGSWAVVPPPSVSSDWEPLDIHFTSPGEGWAVGEDSSTANRKGVLVKYLSETISAPGLPKGPVSGMTGVSCSFSTGDSTSSLMHPVEYQFDWRGDGTDLSPWAGDAFNMNFSSQSKTWTMPGTYKVRARARCTVDTGMVSPWSDTLSVTMNLASGPDLSGSWSIPLTQACRKTGKNQRCTLKGTFTVKNIGNKDASSTYVKFYLSGNSTYEDEDSQLKQIATGKLKPGKSKVINFNLNLATNQTATGKYVITVIDKDNLVAEIDENNNQIIYGPIP
jgi:hypothetical protein